MASFSQDIEIGEKHRAMFRCIVDSERVSCISAITVPSVDLKKAAPGSDPTEPQWTWDNDFKMALREAFCGETSVDEKSQPFFGQPCYITALVGDSVCVSLSPELLKKHPDLESLLSDPDANILSKSPSFYLTQGSVLWQPLGWATLSLGITPGPVWTEAVPQLRESTKAKQRHGLLHGYQFVFDEKLVSLSSRTACLYASNWMRRARDSWPECYRGNAKMDAWTASLEKEPAATAVTDQTIA